MDQRVASCNFSNNFKQNLKKLIFYFNLKNKRELYNKNQLLMIKEQKKINNNDLSSLPPVGRQSSDSSLSDSISSNASSLKDLQIDIFSSSSSSTSSLSFTELSLIPFCDKTKRKSDSAIKRRAKSICYNNRKCNKNIYLKH